MSLCPVGRTFKASHPTCQTCKIGECVEAAQPKKKSQNLTLYLPFKLPTWNQLLAMDHWQRKKVRDWIKKQVYECIVNGAAWQTPTGLARRLQLTDSCLLEYYEMITPNALKKSRTAKKLARLTKR